MKKYRRVNILCVSLLVLFSFSQLTAAIMKGNELVKLMREFEKAMADSDSINSVEASTYLGYVMGVHDATEDLYDIPAAVKAGRLGEIVASFLKRNSDRWGESAAALVIDALQSSYPKKPESDESRPAPLSRKRSM